MTDASAADAPLQDAQTAFSGTREDPTLRRDRGKLYAFTMQGLYAVGVAGVALGLLTRVRPDDGERESPAEHAQWVLQPVSAAICVPLFALFAAGVDLRGTSITTALSSPIAIGVMIGLVVGKPVGVTAAAWLTARFTRARLSTL